MSDADGDELEDCEDPCPYVEQFIDDVVLPRPPSLDGLMVEVAVLVFLEDIDDAPLTVNELSETGADFAFVSDPLELRPLDLEQD